jgi:hypothetical protein
MAIFSKALSIALIIGFHGVSSLITPANSRLKGVSISFHHGVSVNPLLDVSKLQQRRQSASDSKTQLKMAIDLHVTTELISSFDLNLDREQAEALAGPFFGASLFPYLAFLYLLNVEENDCPKGVTVGFATCLLFVFLTIPAAIASQVLYGVSLADSDWLHGSAESLLTMTNLVTVVAFRQALNAKEKELPMPNSATSWAPMTVLVAVLTVLATVTAVVPAVAGASVHTPYLNGFMDLPFSLEGLGANPEPDNALTIAT